ncbi:MAG: phosphatase PAP2 family protein, partial [Calditrichaeota bacterium]|nr:phosphatase PAP2 family protein [Calditrichota bacterium]
IALILKNAIGRLRPVLDLEPGYQLTNESFKFQFFSEYDWNYASMPSGHSVVVFAMALVLSRSFPRLTILFWFIAIVIAASRIILFQHWLSDILASALLVLVLDLLIWNRLVSWFSIEKAAE